MCVLFSCWLIIYSKTCSAFLYYFFKNYIEQLSREITPAARLTNPFSLLIMLLRKNVQFYLLGVNFTICSKVKAVLQQELRVLWVSRGLRKRSVVKLFRKLKIWWNLWDESDLVHSQYYGYIIFPFGKRDYFWESWRPEDLNVICVINNNCCLCHISLNVTTLSCSLTFSRQVPLVKQPLFFQECRD